MDNKTANYIGRRAVGSYGSPRKNLKPAAHKATRRALNREIEELVTEFEAYSPEHLSAFKL